MGKMGTVQGFPIQASEGNRCRLEGNLHDELRLSARVPPSPPHPSFSLCFRPHGAPPSSLERFFLRNMAAGLHGPT